MASRSTIGSAGMLKELGIVFVGVLIALAADSAWENRQDRERLHANLEVLLADMEYGQEALDAAIRADSAAVSALGLAHELILSNSRSRVDELSDLLDYDISINPVPIGTLRLLVNGGDIRLLGDADAKATLVSALSTIDLISGWMDDLATDGRRAGEAIRQAESRALVAGRAWPDAAFGDAEVLAAVDIVRGRIANIGGLLRAIRGNVEGVQAAVRQELGLSTVSGPGDG